MKSSQRLKPVQRINEFNEKNAARAFGEHSQKLNMHRQRLADLGEYQLEYGRRFLESGQQGMSATRLRDYQAFMKNLSDAIAQQRQLVTQYEQENERLKRQWMATHRRSQAIDHVVERKIDEENRTEERRVQRELDDRNNLPKP